jgi:hypothetical protein
VKIGSGCLVWVGSVEKVSKDWNPAFELKPLSLPGGRGEWLLWLSTLRWATGLVSGRHQAFLGAGLRNLQLNCRNQ